MKETKFYQYSIIDKTNYKDSELRRQFYNEDMTEALNFVIKSFEIKNAINKMPTISLSFIGANASRVKLVTDIEVSIAINDGPSLVYNIGVTDTAVTGNISYVFGRLCTEKQLAEIGSGYLGDNVKDALKTLNLKPNIKGDNLSIPGKFWRINETVEDATLRILKGAGNKCYFSISNDSISIIDPKKRSAASVMDLLPTTNTVKFKSSTLLSESKYSSKYDDSKSGWSTYYYKDEQPLITKDNTKFANNYNENRLLSLPPSNKLIVPYRNIYPGYKLGDVINITEQYSIYGMSTGVVISEDTIFGFDSYSSSYTIGSI